MKYLFDSNAFIAAGREYYGFDLAPGFWEWLASEPILTSVSSVKEVHEEISTGKGDLIDWVNDLPSNFWLDHTMDSLEVAGEIAEWVMHSDRIFTLAAREEFLDIADYHLVAKAKAVGATVVTVERSAPDSRKRIKIPDVCKAFHVPCLHPFEAYRQLGLNLK